MEAAGFLIEGGTVADSEYLDQKQRVAKSGLTKLNKTFVDAIPRGYRIITVLPVRYPSATVHAREEAMLQRTVYLNGREIDGVNEFGGGRGSGAGI